MADETPNLGDDAPTESNDTGVGDDTPTAGGDTPAKRPTLWIVLTVVFALAAIGLAIWGFSKKSDLDDANNKLAKQEQQASQTESAASQTESADVAFGDAEKARYRAVRRRLIAARHEERDLNARIATERADLDQAKTNAANADTVAERREAELNVLRQQQELAAACARGAVASYNELIDASTAAVGAREAIRKLEGLQSDCDDVVA